MTLKDIDYRCKPNLKFTYFINQSGDIKIYLIHIERAVDVLGEEIIEKPSAFRIV